MHSRTCGNGVWVRCAITQVHAWSLGQTPVSHKLMVIPPLAGRVVCAVRAEEIIQTDTDLCTVPATGTPCASPVPQLSYSMPFVHSRTCRNASNCGLLKCVSCLRDTHAPESPSQKPLWLPAFPQMREHQIQIMSFSTCTLKI